MLNKQSSYCIKTSKRIMAALRCVAGFLACFVIFCGIAFAEDAPSGESEEVKVDDAKLEYTKGSACKYCEYCRFCDLCDGCPCETSPSKPNCHMCKYCKFCSICKICDTICQPGGVLDRVTAAIVNALPSHNPEEIDKDLDTVKDYINRDEL